MTTFLCICVILFVVLRGIARWTLRTLREGGNSLINLYARHDPEGAERVRDILSVIVDSGKIIIAIIILCLVLSIIF